MKGNLLFLFLATLFFSCENEDLSKTEKLASHGWKISSVKKNGVKTDCSCMSDDCYSFSLSAAEQGNYTITRGPVSCSAEEPSGGTFWMSDAETLALSCAGERTYYKIFFSDSELILICDISGTQWTYTYIKC
ncbi:MAG TPA: hypothetical protein VK207_01555 [Bacteroidales bacterium]|nr:hypothetical protein [Bacteroidales bacterium]